MGARLHSAKNPAAAVQLLKIEPSWHLALAGHGPERSNLTALARSLGVSDRLHFVGELFPSQIGAFLRTLDVFVFPSLAETFGLAVVEAAQCGVPVVANELEILREVLAVPPQAQDFGDFDHRDLAIHPGPPADGPRAEPETFTARSAGGKGFE